MSDGSAATMDNSTQQKLRTDLTMKKHDPSYAFIVPDNDTWCSH